MADQPGNWRRTARTIALTIVITSAFWIVAIALLMQRYGVDFATPRPAASTGSQARVVADDSGQAMSRRPPRYTGSRTAYAAPSGALTVPVIGVAPGDLVDTFTQARAGGERIHDAIDILAPEGAPVVAAAPGTVEKLFFSTGGGGVTAYVRSEDKRWVYYYAHLADYAPGLADGRRVARGDAIGTVGHTGNASAEAPHLHFAINRMAAGERWYQGTPINPYPLLTR